MIYNHELERIQHYINTHGEDYAMDWIKTTYKVYRSCLMRSRKRGFLKPSHASLPEYRRGFIESCVTFRAYMS